MLGVSQNKVDVCGVSVSIQIPTIMFNVHAYACIHYLQTWLGHMLGTLANVCKIAPPHHLVLSFHLISSIPLIREAIT